MELRAFESLRLSINPMFPRAQLPLHKHHTQDQDQTSAIEQRVLPFPSAERKKKKKEENRKESHLKFSAVFGTTSANSSILMRPWGAPPMDTSKNTTGLLGFEGAVCMFLLGKRKKIWKERVGLFFLLRSPTPNPPYNTNWPNLLID